MILCGVDRSAEAAQAARVASDLAARLRVPLLVLHVAPRPWVPDRPYSEYQERLREQEIFERAGSFATVVEPIRVNPAAAVHRLVEFGDPLEVLRSFASDLGATHIVVGSRGQGAVEDVLFTSTSGALLREAPCPVIVVPEDIGEWTYARLDGAIVCGVDDSDSSRAAARRAGELARGLGVRLVLAHVSEDTEGGGPHDDPLEKARTAVPGVPTEVERLQGPPPDELLALGRRTGAALLAVGSRGRGAIAAALLGSFSRKLVQMADRPVMVVSSSAP